MDKEKLRLEYEADLNAGPYYLMKRNGYVYESAITQAGWIAWQAAYLKYSGDVITGLGEY